MADKKVLVKQTRSGNRCEKSQRETLQCLGLGRIGKSAEHTLTPSISGMLKKVGHLIQIESK